jgi:cobalt-zinc-cadmium efflux system outer membrane protein
MKWVASLASCMFLVVGCQRYEALQLTTAQTQPSLADLTAKAAHLEHPLLHADGIDVRATVETTGLTPDSAAIIAVLNNPGLVAERQRRGIAQAQLLEASILPNPTLEATYDPVTGGNTLGAVNAWSVGPNWEVTALITHDAKIAAAEAASVSVSLDVAWQEWVIAQAARKAVFDAIALREQLQATQAVDQQLAEQAKIVRDAVEARQRTIVDASVADAAGAKAHADYLQARRDFRHQQLALNQTLGFPPDMELKLADSTSLPESLALPPESELAGNLDTHRLDLVALRFGYQSQEQTLRAAILGQFPKVVIGIHPSTDNTGVQSVGLGVSVDIPIFDRNQGAIANAKATRQQLFDEFNSRVFESRALTAQTLTDIHELTAQISAAEATLPAVQKLVDVYRDALSRHEVDALSAASAANDLLSRKIDLLKLKQQLADDEVALELATGRSLMNKHIEHSTTQPQQPENR